MVLERENLSGVDQTDLQVLRGTVGDLAKRYGVPASTVRQILSAAGMQPVVRAGDVELFPASARDQVREALGLNAGDFSPPMY